MPYIGRSTDGFGVRNRFVYLASSGDTSVSGADANGATLSFSDGAYVDVYLNGVLLKAGTDYNTNTANTIAGISSMSANDEVTVIVYDIFAVADTVSQSSGGTFSGNVNFSGNIDVDGTANLDVVDIDGNVDIAGTSTLNDDVTFTGANYNVTWDKSDNSLEFGDNAKLKIGTGDDLQIYHDGSNSRVESSTGALIVKSDDIDINSASGESYIGAVANGAVSLYYDNSKKLETVSSGLEVYNGSTGSSPELILKDMNSGVVADDVGGGLFFYTNDGNGQGSNLAIRQKYENSSGGAGMAFEVGTGSSRDERMRLNTSGQLIMRSASADANACITVRQSVGSGLGGIYMDTYAYYANIPGINITNGDTNNARNMEDVEFHRNGSLQGYIRISHSSVSFTSSSDYRLKEDAKEITNAFEQIKKLKPYNFKWKQSGVRQDGFFAHEVGDVFDYVAEGEKDATQVKKKVVRNKEGFVIAQNIEKADWEKRKADADNEEASPKGETTYPTDSTWQEEYEDIKPQTVDNSKLVPMLTACLQEAIAKIETLEAKVKALEEA